MVLLFFFYLLKEKMAKKTLSKRTVHASSVHETQNNQLYYVMIGAMVVLVVTLVYVVFFQNKHSEHFKKPKKYTQAECEKAGKSCHNNSFFNMFKYAKCDSCQGDDGSDGYCC